MKKLIFICLAIWLTTSFEAFCQVDPAGGKTDILVVSNSSTVVSWNSSYVSGNVDILLWDMNSSTFTEIATDVDSTENEYTWNLPLSHPTGDYFRIKIVETGNSDNYLMSESFFSIYAGQSTYNKIEEQKKSDDHILIAPNPSNEITRINWDNMNVKTVKVMTLDGSVLVSENVGKLSEIHINSGLFASGHYLVLLEKADGEFITKKLVIKH